MKDFNDYFLTISVIKDGDEETCTVEYLENFTEEDAKKFLCSQLVDARKRDKECFDYIDAGDDDGENMLYSGTAHFTDYVVSIRLFRKLRGWKNDHRPMEYAPEVISLYETVEKIQNERRMA